MEIYKKLINECKSKEEEEAIFQMFRIIFSLKKHKKLRDIYKNSH